MINVGIIGTGHMAGYHAERFRKNRSVRLKACCDISQERAVEFAKQWEIPAVYNDYKKMLKLEKLDGISNVTPDAMHAQISLDAVNNKIAVLCEKPMATNLKDARRMRDAAEKQNVINMINFSKRDSAGLQKAAQVIASGGIGRIMHVEASYLQDWLGRNTWGDWHTTPSLTWRLSTKHGSTGVLGDLGCHIYDMAAFLCGDITEIDCRLKTFDKGIKKIGEYVLDANDSFVSTVIFKNGALGTIHSSRWATGYADREFIRVYGDKGSIEIDFNKGMDRYFILKGKKYEMKEIVCKPTPNNVNRFVRAIRTGEKDSSDFENGVKIQAYLHYSFLSDRQKCALKTKI